MPVFENRHEREQMHRESGTSLFGQAAPASASATTEIEPPDVVLPPSPAAARELYSIYFGDEGEAREQTHWGRKAIRTAERAHSAGEWLSGHGSEAAHVPVVGGMLKLLTGGVEMADAADEWDEATEKNDGNGQGLAIVNGANGLVETVGAEGTLAGSAIAGPLAGSFGFGVGVGKYGSQAVKEYGWLEDDDGKALTPSEWAANQGLAVNELVEERSHGLLGRNGALDDLAPLFGPIGLLIDGARDAGALATVLASVPGAGAAIAGAAVKGAHVVGDAGPVDVMMNPERYREVEGRPGDVALAHLAKYRGEHAQKERQTQNAHAQKGGQP